MDVAKPPFSCDVDDADLLSVLWVHEDDINMKKWFIRNFIDLWCYETDGIQTMSFDKPFSTKLHCFRPEGTKHNYFDKPFPDSSIHDCQLLSRVEWDRDTLEKKYETITDLIEECISNGLYMFLEIDCFYIPVALFNQRIHYNSRTLIYGFDTEQKILNVADFYGPFDRNVAFKFREVSYEDFIKAYSSYECSKNLEHERLLAFKYSSTEISLNKGELKYALKRYLDGFEDPYNNIRFGVKCYDAISEELDKKYMDFRLFNFVYSHAKAMKMRAAYMKELDVLDESFTDLSAFDELEKFALSCRNSLIKFVVSQDKGVKNKVIQLYEKLRDKDIECTRLLMDHIKDAENVYRWKKGLKEIEQISADNKVIYADKG
ncbi:hypothetical protein BSK48_20040 [Paenibacillus odorifer]|nr:hypothetical protein BSK48_20040 [Paenibacillus odorifer]OMD78635.1 hypothetical protein BSK53_23470 [Paenibacillus odorifer]